MYAKIFGQIFDSSIAADYVVRHVFMDLLVLADRDGVVDMTLDAISRRTNVPEAIVSHAIEELMKPDERSRSHIEDGRRLILLDSHRNWGWQIVNYDHYRTIRDEESRKAYFRDYKRQYRQKSKLSTQSPTMSTVVLDSPTMSTKAEAEAKVEVKSKSTARGTRLPADFSPDESHEKIALERRLDLQWELASFRDHFTAAPGQKGVKLDWAAAFRNWLRGSRNVMPVGFKPTVTTKTKWVDPATNELLFEANQ